MRFNQAVISSAEINSYSAFTAAGACSSHSSCANACNSPAAEAAAGAGASAARAAPTAKATQPTPAQHRRSRNTFMERTKGPLPAKHKLRRQKTAPTRSTYLEAGGKTSTP